MINTLNEAIEPNRQKLVNHSLYKSITSLEDIKKFTEHHVFAVWDFMSLLKSLQQHLTCVNLPWIPTQNPKTRRFINEIVFAEESDVDANGKTLSHYEMYLEAMSQIEADTSIVGEFLELLKSGERVSQALIKLDLPQSVQDFVNFTFDVIKTNKPHVIAAVFTFGREDLIPDMFIEIVKGLGENQSIDKLVYYLERHIELDGDEHGPLSLNMVEELCGNDDYKWQEAIEYSQKALSHRIALWDGVQHEIKMKREPLLA